MKLIKIDNQKFLNIEEIKFSDLRSSIVDRQFLESLDKTKEYYNIYHAQGFCKLNNPVVGDIVVYGDDSYGYLQTVKGEHEKRVCDKIIVYKLLKEKFGSVKRVIDRS